MFELLASYVIVFFLMPLIVKARIKDAYASTRKDVFIKEQELKTMKKGKVVKSKKDEDQFHFYGSMERAMQHMQLMMLLLVTLSAFFIWWSKLEIIFIERSAPKFIFDIVFAGLSLPF